MPRPPVMLPDSVSRPLGSRAPEPGLVQLDASVEALVREARSPNTRRAYAWQWARYIEFCRGHGCAMIDPDAERAARTVARYLAQRAEQGWSVASMAQALSALGEGFRSAGQRSPRESPLVREAWRGLKRAHGRPPRRVAPLAVSELRAVLRALEGRRAHPRSILRDRAMLVMGFAGALRRSELVALAVQDVSVEENGLVLQIQRSKTDAEGRGARVGLPYGSDPRTCPVRAVRAWLADTGLTSGPLFRAVDRHGNLRSPLSGHDVARVVRRSASLAGLDPARFSGHSLRAGLATTAARAGKSDRAIMTQGRWTSRSMVDRYVREATLLAPDNAASGIGL